MSEREPGRLGVSERDTDACRCPLCQSPFISNRRPHDPTPCKEPIARYQFPAREFEAVPA